MCAKPEPAAYLQPIADLHDELQHLGDTVNPLRELHWAGVVTFYAVMENV